MRASLGGKHVSGAERLVGEPLLQETVLELLRRPTSFDQMVLTVEKVEEVSLIEASLPISSRTFESVADARGFALKLLTDSGVPPRTAERGLRLLAEGAGPGGSVMRGAVLMDVETAGRLEEDPQRGVRTVRVDWKNRRAIERTLRERGMTSRTVDALALATKNILCGVVAELCWSDDPDYTTGYVASGKVGYVRIDPLKERGDPKGGRIYFIRKQDLPTLVECLEKRAFLIESLPD